jgi:hypothetical protein
VIVKKESDDGVYEDVEQERRTRGALRNSLRDVNTEFSVYILNEFCFIGLEKGGDDVDGPLRYTGYEEG